MAAGNTGAFRNIVVSIGDIFSYFIIYHVFLNQILRY